MDDDFVTAQVAGPEGGAHRERSLARVLVLDDDGSTAELMRVVLDDAGFEVTVRVTADDLPRRPFDCVVTDLMTLREYDEERARAWLDRLAAAFPGTPVVVVTAHVEAEAAELAGAHRVIRKPFDVDGLVAAVRDLTS